MVMNEQISDGRCTRIEQDSERYVDLVSCGLAPRLDSILIDQLS